MSDGLFMAASADPLGSSVDWMADFLTGEIAVGLSVLAVSFIGFSMLQGRLQLRRGAIVILGSFLILGAPGLANELTQLSGLFEGGRPTAEPFAIEFPSGRDELVPSNYSPYAGAAMRRTRR